MQLTGLLAALAFMVTGAIEGVSYVTGGNNPGDIEHFALMRAHHNVEIKAVNVSGDPIDNFSVRIDDPTDFNWVDETSDGQFFLLKMQAGNYVLSVTHEGQIITKNITVTEGAPRQDIILEFGTAQ